MWGGALKENGRELFGFRVDRRKDLLGMSLQKKPHFSFMYTNFAFHPRCWTIKADVRLEALPP